MNDDDDETLSRSDVLRPPRTGSLTPEGKLTVRLALVGVIVVAMLVALVASVYHVDSAGFWATINTSVGVAGGALTADAHYGRQHNR